MEAIVVPAIPSNVRLPSAKRVPTNLHALVEQFTELLVTQQHRKLEGDEAKRLKGLTEVILEAGTLAEAELHHLGRRAPRTAMRLKVSFGTSREAAQAFTRDVGTGGMAIETQVPMHQGMMLSLLVAAPGLQKPIRVQGEVVWVKDHAAGIAFRDVDDYESGRIKALVAQNFSFVDRIRAALAKPPSVGESQLSVAPSILVQTADRILFDSAVAVLGLRGYHASDSLPASVRPELIAADGAHVANATAQYPGVPFLVLNASGIESLVGKLSKLTPVGFVKRPATAIGLADAIQAALAEQGIRRAS